MGTSFNIVAGSYSLQKFKECFKHSFCIGKTEEQIEEAHQQLVNLYYGNHSTVKGEATEPSGEGNRTGRRSDKKARRNNA